MRLVLNKNNEIVEYASLGDLTGSVEFDGKVPDDFEANFKPSFYLLQDNEIVVNPNYQEPTVSVPEPPEPSGPSPEMLAINALGIQVAKLMSEKGGV